MTQTITEEIDALIAEKVMGWTWKTYPDGPVPHIKHWFKNNGEYHPEHAPPCYSTDISAAWEVVDKMQTLGWYFDIMDCNGGGEDWRACFTPDEDMQKGKLPVSLEADTAPMAICLAALKAAGVNIDE